MNIVRKHIKFYGRVQGVGFRYRAEKSASIYGIKGWIRNNDDGTVEMEAQGERENIMNMMDLIKQGNFIEIEYTEERNIPLKDDEYGFNIED
jgi:acylphosphatase